jgi:hypothetical protein
VCRTKREVPEQRNRAVKCSSPDWIFTQETTMTEPRDDKQQADGNDANTERYGDPSRDLDIRPEDVDHVKGGALPRRIEEDPCQGGQISKKLG